MTTSVGDSFSVSTNFKCTDKCTTFLFVMSSWLVSLINIQTNSIYQLTVHLIKMFATKFQNAHRVYNRQDTSNFSNTIQILKLVSVSHITQIELAVWILCG